MDKLTVEDLMSLEQLRPRARRVPRPVLEHKRNRKLAIGPNVHLVLRGPADHAVPGAGDAARRAHLRARGHPRGARCLQPADSRRQQLEGDPADRVPRRRRAAARSSRSSSASKTAAGCRCVATTACSRSPTKICERENDEKTSAVHFLRFELTAAMIARSRRAARRSAPGVDHDHYRHVPVGSHPRERR